MTRLPHGVVPTVADLAEARAALAERSAAVPLAFALGPPIDVHDFDFMFPTLQDPQHLLPVNAQTTQRLKVLGRAMEDDDAAGGANDAPIPAAYTYFGQFVDHDITLEAQDPFSGSGGMGELLSTTMEPLPLPDVRNALRNFRSATLDLDSLYGLPAPRDPTDGRKMRVGLVTDLNAGAKPFLRPPGKSDDNDLPREPRSTDRLHDRAALIGDPRNDENTIVAQLHVAFLKAHNALVDEGRSFEEARRVLRQHYQHVVIRDYLPRVADPAVVEDILSQGNRWYDALTEPFFMPLEFAVAAYRFGHTMVRAAYNFNVNFNLAEIPATLELLFTFTALSGQIGAAPTDTDTLPENWLIEWENIIGERPDVGKARRIDTRLAATGGRALFNLHDVEGATATPADAARLAVRNLLRGYRLRIPTGQAIAAHLGLPVLTPAQLSAAAGSKQQVAALTAGGFLDRTPLWYYVLAEAKHHGGARLGPVGSVLVAEVLVGLVRRSEDSILSQPGWSPSLPAEVPGTFTLSDLLRFAGVLGRKQTSTTYTVRSGDTLRKIAQNELGDAARWVEIFLLNRSTIRHPDRIVVGQQLMLPTGPATQPLPRIYVVRRGDTLAKIAQRELGDAARWPEIFALNHAIITNPDVIVPEMVLVLPA